MTTKYNNWKLERDNQDIVWLTIDKAGTKTNVLSHELISEFDEIITDLTAAPPRGVVLLSGKESGFIAGADVNEFTKLNSEDEALAVINKTHDIFDRFEKLTCPTIAMIHGFCLGGGLELALACKYRVADDDPKTKLGLPEVKLGIHPGFGGTYRSIKTMGAMAAMNLMLTGRNLNARAARKQGLIDFAIPRRHFVNAAKSIIQKPPAKKSLSLINKLASYKHIRPLIAKIMIKKVSSRAPRAHYPAPYALIDLWVQQYDNPKTMLAREAQSVAKLIVTRTAQNLIRVFLLQEQLKGLGRVDNYFPKHVHVIGGGVMGGDIAAWCAYSGFTVTIQDNKKEALGAVVKRAYTLYKKRLKIKRLITDAMDRLIPDPRGHGLKRADVVIEAVFEDAEVKKNLFQSIEKKVKPEAILATNTSSIPLDEINVALKHPERLVGLHFFNPVALMPLVEIAKSPTTGQDVSSKAAAFTRKINKLPLPVTSTPGFLVNRILMPYLMEAVLLAEEKVPLSVIDKAATDFGMPMGPIELADTVGLEICLHVAENLSKSMNIEVPARLKSMVDNGKLGKKTGEGFYQFKNGKPVKERPGKEYAPPVDIQDRLILRLLNEAVACLRDKVVETPDQADAGIIFGTGFAPFRGGPFSYIRHRGPAQLTKMLEHLQQRYGPRFTADNGWEQLD
jgi:3-hydroxyacyl-CoA dehydrogenase/enoyl-CoA hydratase/3-hydroxybutyryl-CoA epimerase